MNIRQTLAARAKETGCSYKQLLTHYAMERFLYRLSCSPHAGSFFLKGGMLLMGMGTAPARTTMDIDLLGRVDNSPENIARVFRSILHAKTHGSDNVAFDAASMRTSEIMKDALYVGVRVTLNANVAGEPCAVSVDIGFSDEIYPKPVELQYPPTIPGQPTAKLLCYTRESMVAEKWQAMVELGRFNSRMKDFYDLWFLMHHYAFKMASLQEAIRQTFERRGTSPGKYVSLRNADFIDSHQPEWATYVTKLKSATYMRKPKVVLPSKDFAAVMAEILEWLGPVMEQSAYALWKPGRGWR